MIAHCFAAAPPQKLPLGRAFGGRNVYLPFRHAVVQLVHLVTPHLDMKAGPADVFPLPRGMSIARSDVNNQLQLVLTDGYTRRMRRAYGFVGEIKLSDGEGTLTPAHLQIITMVHWRYAMVE